MRRYDEQALEMARLLERAKSRLSRSLHSKLLHCDKVKHFAPEISVLEPVKIGCFTVSGIRGLQACQMSARAVL